MVGGLAGPPAVQNGDRTQELVCREGQLLSKPVAARLDVSLVQSSFSIGPICAALAEGKSAIEGVLRLVPKGLP